MIVHMIGNAHLDPVWLWPWQSGADEAVATFAHAIARCDETPEFVYTRGEAWLFSLVEKLAPDLFERAKALIAEGRWQLVGGQWVQPDCNGPTLDGWNAQLEIGARYFAEKFGIKARVGYNVDSFGHPATLPDILASHGLESYCFHRPGPHQVDLPAQTFRWRGINGGEVTGFRIAQAYVTRTDDLYGQIMLTLEAANSDLGHTMCFYGVGNHGGGPTKGNIQYILDNLDFAPGVELRFSHPQAYFDAIAPHISALPVVEFELQKTFPGCYSVMADIKRAQHRGEQKLAQAGDVVAHFSTSEADRNDRTSQLETAWRDLAFTQFHDILAGTSASRAWESVRAMQGRALVAGEEIVLETTRTWARQELPGVNFQQIALFNANAEAWNGWIEHEPFLDFDLWDSRWISDEAGAAVPFQRLQPDANIMLSNRVLFKAQIDSRNTQILLVRDDARPEDSFVSELKVDANSIQNARVKVEVSKEGARVFDGEGQLLFDWNLHLRADASDTWTFVQNRFPEAVLQTTNNWEWQVEESGLLRAKLRGICELGTSRLQMWVWVYHDEPTLHWRLEVNWNERYALLQMPLSLAAATADRRDGLTGGFVTRKGDAFEHPFQKWSQNGSLSLVSPDIYSLSGRDTEWQFTLLRAPRMAWGGGDPDVFAGRETFTDQGFHIFEGQFMLGHVEPDALDSCWKNCVRAPIVFDRYEGLDRPPWGNNPRTELWTGAEQRARRDGKMSHLIDNGELDRLAAPTGELPAEIEETL